MTLDDSASVRHVGEQRDEDDQRDRHYGGHHLRRENSPAMATGGGCGRTTASSVGEASLVLAADFYRVERRWIDDACSRAEAHARSNRSRCPGSRRACRRAGQRRGAAPNAVRLFGDGNDESFNAQMIVSKSNLGVSALAVPATSRVGLNLRRRAAVCDPRCRRSAGADHRRYSVDIHNDDRGDPCPTKLGKIESLT
jgi:hypothetical protein